MTTTFPAYAFEVRSVDVFAAMFDPAKGKFNPLSKVKPPKGEPRVRTELILDSITLAVEAGIVPSDGWVKFLFGTKAVFANFLEELSNYDVCYRITDRWWTALAVLAEVVDEEQFISCAEIAVGLQEAAEASGQL